MKKIYSLILRPVLAFLYILGLSFIIPFLLATKLPEEIAIKYNSFFFLIIAIILLLVSIIGTFYIKKNISKAFKSLAYYSLVPGILSLITTIFGKDFLINFFTKYTKALEPIIITYIDSRVPKLWFLTIAYILLGMLLYYIGRKFKS